MAKMSVVVLNFNGSAVVLQCLRSVVALDWHDLEIIVVDNASQDGSPEQIAAEFGERVRIIRRRVNSPTAGRNEGFEAATGEYILSLDNDIVLRDSMIVQKAMDILAQFGNVGVLSFKIAGPDLPNQPLPEHWWHPLSLAEGQDRRFYTDWFAEGAVIFRAEALRATGGYDATLFHGFESVDLALRLLDHRYDILYCPEITSVELRVRGMQPVVRSRINYLTLRNKLWTAWKDYPLWQGIYFGASRIAAAGVRAVRYGWFDLWLRAVTEGVFAPRAIRARRQPIRQTTWKRIRRIRRGQALLGTGTAN